MEEPATPSQRAIILFADIAGSTQFGLTQTPERYDEILRAFHRMAHGAVKECRAAHGLEDERLYAHAKGDECHAFFTGGIPGEDECHALRLAMLLKEGWMSLDFASELAEFGRNRFGTRVDLRIGIGGGDVVSTPDVWTGSTTLEGVVINEAKRIEGLAAKLAPDTFMLVKVDIKDAAQRAGLAVEFGELIWAEATGFLTGTHKDPVYPVLPWGGFTPVS